MRSQGDMPIRIYDVFYHMSVNVGIRGTTLDAVAKSLRISKKTIFRYYESKDELVSKVADRIIAEIQLLVERRMEASQTALDKYIGIYADVGGYLSGIGDMLIVDIQQLYPGLWERIDAARMDGMHVFRGLLEEGMASGQFRRLNPDIVTAMIAASIAAVINPVFLIACGISLRDAAEDVRTVFGSGIISNSSGWSYR